MKTIKINRNLFDEIFDILNAYTRPGFKGYDEYAKEALEFIKNKEIINDFPIEEDKWSGYGYRLLSSIFDLNAYRSIY
jgi:hypothetical protein